MSQGVKGLNIKYRPFTQNNVRQDSPNKAEQILKCSRSEASLSVPVALKKAPFSLSRVPGFSCVWNSGLSPGLLAAEAGNLQVHWSVTGWESASLPLLELPL